MTTQRHVCDRLVAREGQNREKAATQHNNSKLEYALALACTLSCFGEKHAQQTPVPVSVLYLASAQSALLDLDLLIQQRQLVIATDKLRAQDVPLTKHQVQLLLLS